MAKSCTNAEREERIDYIEGLMCRKLRTADISRESKRKFGIAARQTRRYMAAVRARWIKEASTVDREQRRTENRESLREIVAACWAQREVVRDEDGKPIRKKNGDVVTIPKPNLSAAARALDYMAKLDALYHVDLEGEAQARVEELLELARSSMSDEAFNELLDALNVAKQKAAGG